MNPCFFSVIRMFLPVDVYSVRFSDRVFSASVNVFENVTMNPCYFDGTGLVC